MPRDGVATLIQRIARQARLTFQAGAGGQRGEPPGFPENLSRLQGLLSQVRAEDLNIAPRRAAPQPRPPGLPPVTYMHICETEGFSLGVFLLKSGASIPLHDHPGMHGLLKVLYGTVRISCLDALGTDAADGPRPRAPPPGQRFEPPLRAREREAVRAGVLRSRAEYTAASAPCVLTPQRDNLHQIDAVGGPAAFLDILAPPYDPADGRDCHYYRVLEPLGGQPEAAAELPREVWLLETPQADDFWCEGEPYPGPKVAP